MFDAVTMRGVAANYAASSGSGKGSRSSSSISSITSDGGHSAGAGSLKAISRSNSNLSVKYMQSIFSMQVKGYSEWQTMRLKRRSKVSGVTEFTRKEGTDSNDLYRCVLSQLDAEDFFHISHLPTTRLASRTSNPDPKTPFEQDAETVSGSDEDLGQDASPAVTKEEKASVPCQGRCVGKGHKGVCRP